MGFNSYKKLKGLEAGNCPEKSLGFQRGQIKLKKVRQRRPNKMLVIA